jgi:hypothetical protein
MMGSSSPNQTHGVSIWRYAARTVGILAVIAGFFPSGFYQGGAVRNEAERDYLNRNSETMPFRAEYSLGFQSSPLIHGYSEATLVTDEATKVSLQRSSGLRFNLISWSMFGIVSGVVLLWTAGTGRGRAGGIKDGDAITDTR